MTKTTKYKYIGFNDTWFMIIGIPLLALLIIFLFDSICTNVIDCGLSFLISLIFTFVNWMAMRKAMILLRKKFPDLKDSIKRNLIFFVSIILIILTINAIGDLVLKSFFGPTFNSPNFKGNVIIILVSMMSMAIYEAIYYSNKLRQSIIKEEHTRQIIVQSKLDALTNQARPHFLFNSLNTLKDIIDNDPKENASDFVDNLADVYRFILDTGSAKLVSLKEEIDFAKSYEHIQKERFGSNLLIEWNLPENKGNMAIIPMSIQLLIENAIKHNIVSKSKPLKIEVSFNGEFIEVRNNLQLKTTSLPSTKIGLENIKKRYELTGNVLPKIEQTETHFVVLIPVFENTK